ncbi:PEP-CTERM sorting domain-containing protein [Candidatus Poribacteria bacterium]|nr:PEP-CTERM sorting domain-containing protein [Candidatus Poribacteria bacterium]
MFKTCFTLTIAVIVAVMFLMPLAAHAVMISGGLDFWTTDEAEVEIPGFGMVSLTGFLFPPDNPFFPVPDRPEVQQVLFQVDWFDRHGNQVDRNSVHKVTQVKKPRPDLGPFDTIVKRKADVNIIGVDSEATVPIEIIWLSLMSVEPKDYLGLGFKQDIYVGLHDTDGDRNTPNQIEGKMKLKSNVGDGTTGKVDIGLKPQEGTIEDPNDPTFLGLPVTYDVIFVPEGTLNEVHREMGQSIFHGDTKSPSGNYQVVPEPSTWLLLCVGLVILLGFGRKRSSRKA